MQKYFRTPMGLTVCIILGLLLLHLSLWLGRLFLPGFIGEFCGKVQGIAFTPFFMEFFLIAFGFMVVLILNQLRKKWDGEELVYLEVVDDPVEMPASSKSVILAEHEKREDSIEVSLAAIEGSLALKDYAQAQELITEAFKITPQNKKLDILQTKLNNIKS